jgi:predicted PurR-regulated permease PerM
MPREGHHCWHARLSAIRHGPPRITVTDPHSPSPPAEQIRPIDRVAASVVLAVIVVGCYFVLQPFLSAMLWAFILCCATWPVFLRVRKLARGSDGWASLMMTLAIAAVVLAPFVIVGVSLADNAAELLEGGKRLVAEGPPEPPEWVGKLPLIGSRAEAYWASFAHDKTRLLSELKNYIDPLRNFAIASGEVLARGIMQLALSVFIAFFVYRDGEAMTRRLMATIVRIFGERGRHLATLATNTMRGVVYGILGTALIQGILVAVGFALAGVPAAPLFGLATFFLSPLPIGPPLIWLPAALWLFNHGSTGWAIFMLVWGVAVVSSVDNVIKPLIISRGSNMPFILVMLGVLGGVVAFGFIGVFLGPTLLAIGYALLGDWSKESIEPAKPKAKV